jgi:PAS domain S-box-containing protein
MDTQDLFRGTAGVAEDGPVPLFLDQGVLDAIPVGVYLCAADGAIIGFNERAAELWGRKPKLRDTDQRFCGAFRLFRPDGSPLPHAETPMERVLRTGEPAQNEEVVIERPDGSRIVALVNIRAVKSPSGRVQGAINCFQDITERKRQESALREGEYRLQAVLDALPAAVYTTDAEGRVTFYNRAAAEIAGREPEIGKDRWCVAWKLSHADSTPLPHDECPMALALKERRPIRGVEAVAESPSGERVPFMPYPTPLFDSEGRLVGGVNMLVDLRERKEAERRLIESEARFRGIFDNARVAIWEEDFSGVRDLLERLRGQGVADIRAFLFEHPEIVREAVGLVRVLNVNDYTVELYEAPNKDALLVSLERIFVPETLPVFLEEMVALWDGRRRFESEAQVRTFSGRPLEILLTIAFEGERCERAIVSILDISRQKAAERRVASLSAVGRAITRDLDLERIVQTATDAARELSGAEFGAFFYNTSDESGGTYMLYALSGAPRAAFEKFGMPRNTALFDPTFRGEGVVRSADIRNDPRYGKSPPHYGMPEGHLPVVSYLAVPVVSASGTVHGGLFFGHHQPDVFTKEAEELVAGVAAHAAVAIDNARLFESAEREIEARRRTEEERTLLINELNHRVKNTLATVQSLAMQSLRNTRDVAGSLTTFESRLTALSRAHDLLTQQNWQWARLEEVVERTVAPFGAEARIAVRGPSVRLSPKQALALSMALHELATNAVKYGALSNEKGRVEIVWSVGGSGELELTWTERDGPPVEPPERMGFGTRLISRNLAHDLGAPAVMEFRPEGVFAALRTPAQAPK